MSDNILDKILSDDPNLRKEISERMDKLIVGMTELYEKVQAKPYTAEYWQRYNDLRALHFIFECMVEYRKTGECSMIHNGLCDLYVLDKTDRTIHRVGEGSHDSLTAYAQGGVHYENMQNGDGGGVDSDSDYGYAILQSDSGYLCNEWGIIDKNYVKEILEYLKDQGEDISMFDENGNYLRKDE